MRRIGTTLNRLFRLLILVAFTAQHFACCCSGVGTEHSAASHQQSAESTCHSFSQPREEFGEKVDHNCSDESQDSPHDHHCCVLTHLVFVSAKHFHLTYRINVSPIGVDSPLTRVACKHFRKLNCYIVPTTYCGPQRSKLCVYRI